MSPILAYRSSHVLGVGADEDAPLVAGAEESDPQGIAHAAAVAEVERPEAGAGRDPGGHGAAEEVTPRHLDDVAEIVLTSLLLAFRQIHPRTSRGFRPHHEAQHDFRK
jgi:hypothetical protein